MNGRYNGFVQLSELVDQLLPAPHQFQGFLARFESHEGIDVSTGDEVVSLAR